MSVGLSVCLTVCLSVWLAGWLAGRFSLSNFLASQQVSEILEQPQFLIQTEFSREMLGAYNYAIWFQLLQIEEGTCTGNGVIISVIRGVKFAHHLMAISFCAL